MVGCNSSFCDGNICTQCIYPYVHNPADSCSQCYLHCRLCGGEICYRCQLSSCQYACEIADCPIPCPGMQNVVCPKCPDGFYKYGSTSHCYRCFYTGCKCSATNNCIDCLPGRHDTTSKCQYTCPRQCITCTSANNCSECVTGKYGLKCSLDCISQCQDGSCDKDSGMCPSGCPANAYLDSNRKCRSCPARCGSCTDFTHCISCIKSHYWGSVCEKDCIGCDDYCSNDTGCMSECLGRYYRKYNKSLNGYECVPCPESCKSCSNANQCTICETGKWGNACQYNCSGCNASCNIHDGCTSVCLSGYYGIVINGGIHCKICPDNCVSCRDNETCEECRSGLYLPDDTNCIVCPDKCLGNDCITHKGICTNGCLNGWTGHQCNQECPAGCLLCEQFNSSYCSSCKIGFYGNSCENICSVHCKQNNGHNVCHRFDGSCIKGCETGYWGQNCSRPCGLGCYGNQCNETHGICLSGCKQNFSGNQCNQKCSYVKDIVCTDQSNSVNLDGKSHIVNKFMCLCGIGIFIKELKPQCSKDYILKLFSQEYHRYIFFAQIPMF